MEFTPEQLTKATAAKSAEELIALAKENGMELSEEEAKKFFAELNKEGALADDELDNVSGGCGDEIVKKDVFFFTCPFCYVKGRYDLTYYKYSAFRQDPWNCPGCGAGVAVCDSSSNAEFTKDGKTILVYR